MLRLIFLQRKNVDKQTALFTTRVTTTRMIQRQLKDCGSLTVADGKLGRPCPVTPPPLLLLLLLHLHLLFFFFFFFFFFLLLVGSSAPISLHLENKTLSSAPTPSKSKVVTAKAQNKAYNNNIIIFLLLLIFFFFFFFFLKISSRVPSAWNQKFFPQLQL
jgi:hypothetical protein